MLVPANLETPLFGENQHEDLVAGTSKPSKLQMEKIEEIKSSLSKELLSDLTKMLAENQKEMLKLMSPTMKKLPNPLENADTDSEPENILPRVASTPVKSKTTTNAKITPVNSRNMVNGVLNYSTNMSKKMTRSLCPQSLPPNERPTFSSLLFVHQTDIYQPTHMPPMPKALTASLPVFDGKSEKFELFGDLFRNNIKM